MKRFTISELNGLIASEHLQIVKTENIYYKITGLFNVAKKV